MDIETLAEYWKIEPGAIEAHYSKNSTITGVMEDTFWVENDDNERLLLAALKIIFCEPPVGISSGVKAYFSQMKNKPDDIFIHKHKLDILTAWRYSLLFRTNLANLRSFVLQEIKKNTRRNDTAAEITPVIMVNRKSETIAAKGTVDSDEARSYKIPPHEEMGIRGGTLVIKKTQFEFVFDDYAERIPIYTVYYKYTKDDVEQAVKLDYVEDNPDTDPDFSEQVISSSNEHLEIDFDRDFMITKIEITETRTV
ncbi:hypothetical protein AGMMS50230_08230 [Spirochaetia bacterium]|nr:hypothetical protein AGMMS50230_08230 [Spirochaetia bacterium]